MSYVSCGHEYREHRAPAWMHQPAEPGLPDRQRVHRYSFGDLLPLYQRIVWRKWVTAAG